MAQALQLSSSKHPKVTYSIRPIITIDFLQDATFVIVVFAIALLILVGVASYIFFRHLSRRKEGASNSNDMIFTFNNNHQKSHLILLMDDDSPSAGPRFYPRNSFINLESKSFTSINISPSRPIIFGHEMDSEEYIRIVLTPPTPAKRKKRRESLIDYESEEDLPAYS